MVIFNNSEMFLDRLKSEMCGVETFCDHVKEQIQSK